MHFHMHVYLHLKVNSLMNNKLDKKTAVRYLPRYCQRCTLDIHSESILHQAGALQPAPSLLIAHHVPHPDPVNQHDMRTRLNKVWWNTGELPTNSKVEDDVEILVKRCLAATQASKRRGPLALINPGERERHH
jgi:hypothetical protein